MGVCVPSVKVMAFVDWPECMEIGVSDGRAYARSEGTCLSCPLSVAIFFLGALALGFGPSLGEGAGAAVGAGSGSGGGSECWFSSEASHAAIACGAASSWSGEVEPPSSG